VKILYLMTAPPPAVPATDAVIQEAMALRDRLGGEILYLPPFRRPTSKIPRAVYGLQRLGHFQRAQETADLVHIYHAELYPFPILRWLRKPLVYSVVSGVQAESVPKSLRMFQRSARPGAIVVPTETDRDLLHSAGLEARHFRPGIDLAAFEPSDPPGNEGFTLLLGSAPWTRKQFRTKGFDSLLAVLRRDPDLRLLLLWRGWLEDRIRREVRRAGMQDRVEILSGKVDVARQLERVHAAVVLADKRRLVKAFPHSLLEALAVARPVLVSTAIPMADFVRDKGCGEVVDSLEPAVLSAAVQALRDDYPRYQASAKALDREDFSRERLIGNYASLYRELLSTS